MRTIFADETNLDEFKYACVYSRNQKLFFLHYDTGYLKGGRPLPDAENYCHTIVHHSLAKYISAFGRKIQ